MDIIEEDGQFIVRAWCNTPSGLLFAGVAWFGSHQEAWDFIYKKVVDIPL